MKRKLRDNWPPYEDVKDFLEHQQRVLDAQVRQSEEELYRARYEQGVRQYWEQRAMEEQERKERWNPVYGAMTLFGWLVFWRAMFNMGRKK